MIRDPYLIDQRIRYSLIHDALPPAPAKVCELGVGHGWLLHLLHDEGYHVHGCDVSLGALPPDSPVRQHVVETTGSKLPFPDHCFDATYSCDVLEHVSPAERPAFLEEMIRVTKPGGVVALTAFFHNTPAFRFFGVGHLLMRGTLPLWYTEHLTIPLPSESETLDHFTKSLRRVKHTSYLRGVGLSVMWLQLIFAHRRYLSRFLYRLSHLVSKDHDLGRTTSACFIGTKPE